LAALARSKPPPAKTGEEERHLETLNAAGERGGTKPKESHVSLSGRYDTAGINGKSEPKSGDLNGRLR